MDGKYDGKWQYYSQDGKIDGECDFSKGKGIYKGYYSSGTLQTKGLMEDDLRVGTWELYEPDGTSPVIISRFTRTMSWPVRSMH